MKLQASSITQLQTILTVCNICGIETVIIEDGAVRGVNEAKTCALISTEHVPDFSQRIGLGRLGALRARLELFAGSANLVIDTKETERGEIASLDISAGRQRAQFRCTSSVLIKAPRSINDNAAAVISLQKSECRAVLDALKVMGSKKAALSMRPDGSVAFEAADSSNDIFKIDLDAPAAWVDTDNSPSSSMVYYYPVDTLAPVLRSVCEADETDLVIGAAGTCRVEIMGHTVTLLPQINEDA